MASNYVPEPIQRWSAGTESESSIGEKFGDKDVESGRQARAFPIRVLAWPIIVIVMQFTLLMLTVGLFGHVRARGQVPLPFATAVFFRDEHQVATYVVTFLSTILSTFSGFLLSQAIRVAMVVHLSHQPIQISALQSMIKLAGKSLIMNGRDLRWTACAAIVFLAAMEQTASWNTLFTPTTITLDVPMVGAEVDIANPSLLAQFNNLYLNEIRGTLNTTVTAVTNTAGTTNALSATGYSTIFNFGSEAYDATTGGILPVNMVFDAPAGSPPPVSIYPQYFNTRNTEALPPLVTDLNVTMVQQGLTAAVSCAAQNLNAQTDPSVTPRQAPAQVTIAGRAKRAHGRVAKLSFTGNVLIIAGCQRPNSTTDYTIVIYPFGIYRDMGSIVCRVSPQIVNVTTTYTPRLISTVFNNSATPIPINGDVTFAVLDMLTQVIGLGQSESSNVIGDAIMNIFSDQVYGDLQYTDLWEQYFLGALGFISTAIKTQLAVPKTGVFAPNGLPESMSKAIRGTATVATIGWQYTVEGGLLLIPSIFIALLSIAVASYAIFEALRVRVETRAAFDPCDPIALMAAASAGGMEHAFVGLGANEVEAGKEKRIRLGRTRSGREGLVESMD
ncbi:unnamed protein product [Mycena citricolor]|uniref:Uncharacterized protein n=1 Tax=Mycena citricolor TaxID=2018698 RepID=A0AAD2GU75_9AGAR|nr:unnamed protein product [Mycena citricolor]